MQEEAKCFSFLIFFKFTFDSLVTHPSYMSDVYGALIREKVVAQQVKYKWLTNCLTIVDDLLFHVQFLLRMGHSHWSSGTSHSPSPTYRWPQKMDNPKWFLETWKWKRNVTRCLRSYIFFEWAHAKNMLQGGSTRLLLHSINSKLLTHCSLIQKSTLPKSCWLQNCARPGLWSVHGQTEVNQLDFKWSLEMIHHHDVVQFYISVDHLEPLKCIKCSGHLKVQGQLECKA